MLISSGMSWESEYGYSRAVRVGNFIAVAGTTAGKDDQGKIVCEGDVYAQTIMALQKIEHALNQAGARISDVIRTRTFMTDITQFQHVARAHNEFFGDVLPAATLVEVRALVEPGLLVEIEADAIIAEQ